MAMAMELSKEEATSAVKTGLLQSPSLLAIESKHKKKLILGTAQKVLKEVLQEQKPKSSKAGKPKGPGRWPAKVQVQESGNANDSDGDHGDSSKDDSQDDVEEDDQVPCDAPTLEERNALGRQPPKQWQRAKILYMEDGEPTWYRLGDLES
jgi:hypothetical protein